MCGLVGVVGNIYDKDKRAFKYLLRLDTFRGEHSTGVASVTPTKSPEIQLAKEVGPPDFLFTKDSFDNGVWKAPTKVLIGHNRYATTGKINEENAHPFHHGEVVGAHNGTLESTKLNLLEKGWDFDVDSEAVFYNIDKYGHEKTIPNVCGAYALTWWDNYDQKMYFIRNSERTLYYTRSKDMDVLFWASEKWMLEIALAKAGVAHNEIYAFDEDFLYSIDVSDPGFAFRKVPLMRESKLEGHPIPYTVHTYSGYGAWGQGYGNTYYPNQPALVPPPKKEGKVVPFINASSDSSLPSLDEAALTKLEGTEIVFWVDKELESNGLKYLRAIPAKVGEMYEIRIYGDHHPDYEKWKTGSGKWKGTVKAAVSFYRSGKHYLYVRLDLRSIEPDVIVDKPTSGYVGYQGRKLTEEEWFKNTADGCAWCSECVTPMDKIMFIDEKSFVCSDCQHNTDVQHYLSGQVH